MFTYILYTCMNTSTECTFWIYILQTECIHVFLRNIFMYMYLNMYMFLYMSV